jgi:amino acid transporter
VDRNDKSRFAYKSPFQPFLSIWAIVWTTFFILVNGFTVFYKWNISKFLTACLCALFVDFPMVSRQTDFRFSPPHPDINIPIFVVLYFGYKIVYRSKIPALKDADLVTNIPTMEETERPEILPTTILGKIAAVLF